MLFGNTSVPGLRRAIIWFRNGIVRAAKAISVRMLFLEPFIVMAARPVPMSSDQVYVIEAIKWSLKI